MLYHAEQHTDILSDDVASGWAKDGAVQEQIDASIEDALKNVRDRLHAGQSLQHCEECGAEIPLARREAVPGVHLCLACQNEADQQIKVHNLYNRRGSKDSQLR
jgi:phage/conjugal plasmid C-4 type zinc finger TraR family protein